MGSEGNFLPMILAESLYLPVTLKAANAGHNHTN